MSSVLFITPVVPDCNGSGRHKRAHQWMASLRKQYNNVHILVVISGENNVPPISDHNIRFLRVEYSKSAKLWQLLRSLLGFFFNKPTGAVHLGWLPMTKETSDIVHRWYESQHFDKIVCFRLYLAEFATSIHKLCNSKQLWLDIDDLESQTWGRIANLYFNNRKLKTGSFYKLAAAQFYRNESKLINAFNKVLVCSSKDRDYLFSRFPHASIDIFPNRIYGKSIPPKQTAETKRLLFVGTLNYYPNEEGISWFIHNVFIPLRSIDNEVELIVAGRNPSPYLQHLLSNTQGVIMYENFADPGIIYSQANIVIAPIRAGGGTKLKVLEAIQHGLPVIATEEAIGGLELISGKDFIHAEAPDDFHSACLSLLQNKSHGLLLAQSAQKKLTSCYTYY